MGTCTGSCASALFCSSLRWFSHQEGLSIRELPRLLFIHLQPYPDLGSRPIRTRRQPKHSIGLPLGSSSVTRVDEHTARCCRRLYCSDVHVGILSNKRNAGLHRLPRLSRPT